MSTTTEPTPEVVEELARVIYGDGSEKDHRAWLRTVNGSPNSASWDIARDVLAAGYKPPLENTLQERLAALSPHSAHREALQIISAANDALRAAGVDKRGARLVDRIGLLAAENERLREALEEVVPEDLRRHGENCDAEMERLRAGSAVLVEALGANTKTAETNLKAWLRLRSQVTAARALAEQWQEAQAYNRAHLGELRRPVPAPEDFLAALDSEPGS